MNVLVTGATGFIGNYVIEELLKRQHSIIAVSLDEKLAKNKSWYKSVSNISFDINLFDSGIDLYHYFNQPDLLIHLAWGGLPNYKSDIHLTENLPNQYDFLENLIKNGLKDLTIAGTCFEYGMREGCLSEDMKPKPDNAYAKAKNYLRERIELLQNSYQFSLKWVRLFYMFGKGQNSKSLIPQLEHALEENQAFFNMSGGEQVRDFLPVEDVAKGIIRVAMQKKVDGIINVCSNNPVSVRQFVLDYLKLHNKKISLNLGVYPYPDFEPMKFWGDNTKFKKIETNE